MSLNTKDNLNATSRNKETSQENLYRTPQIIPIGKAIELLQGGTGKHNDGYSGYYWNEEG